MAEIRENNDDFIGRRKSRRACEPCRRYKRKCIDRGSGACTACLRYGYECYFDDSGRKRGRLGNGGISVSSRVNQPRGSSLTPEAPQRQPAPTATAFTQSLGDHLSDGNEKSDHLLTRYYAWNLGLRLGSGFGKSLTGLVSVKEAKRYVKVYFEKVHPIYHFVDHVEVEEQLNNRWSGNASTSHEYDVVMSGVIALGSLFSGTQQLAKETELIELSKTILDSYNPVQAATPSSLTSITGYILRVLYIRMATDSHSAWVASRAAIAAIEGYVSSNEASFNETSGCSAYNACSTPSHRLLHCRLHWIAKALDIWTCNEHHSISERMKFVRIECPIPNTPGSNDQLPMLLSIFQLSFPILNTSIDHTLINLISILDMVKKLPSDLHDVLQLHKSSYAFCIYRFMRQTSSTIPPTTLSLIISLIKPAMTAALRLAQDSQPWWLIPHVPFQFLCVLLSMDTTESFSEVQGAMNTLRAIASCTIGKTEQMHKVVTVSETLVRLCQKRKEQAAGLLAQSSQSMGTDLTPIISEAPMSTLLESLEMDVAAQFSHEDFTWDDFFV
jgi:hypothetical protein